MHTTQGTQALLDLEDSSASYLLERVPGSNEPIWPHVRMLFAQAMSKVELNTSVVSGSVSKRAMYERLVKAHLPMGGMYQIPRKQSDLCFIVGGTTVRDTPLGRENWLVDAFARSHAGSSVVIQDLPLPADHAELAFLDTYSFDLAHARVDLSARLSPLDEAGSNLVRHVVQSAGRDLAFPLASDQLAAIETAGIRILGRAPHLRNQYSRLLDRVEPTIVFMEDASYGARSGVIELMKARGILVIEPQHGWIGPSHGAYNFGAAMGTPDLIRTIPDVLMTFGDFWSSGVRFPGTSISVGKPHMDEMTQDLPALSERPRDVVVASSVADPDEAAQFTLALREALPSDWRVLFRPHPSERQVLDVRYPSLVDVAGIEFDMNADVYTTLRSVRGVVGVASTVLYEALAMGCHVFVRESAFSAYYVDEAIFGEPIAGDGAGVRRMASELIGREAPRVSAEVRDSVWKPDAVANFSEALTELRSKES